MDLDREFDCDKVTVVRLDGSIETIDEGYKGLAHSDVSLRLLDREGKLMDVSFWANSVWLVFHEK